MLNRRTLIAATGAAALARPAHAQNFPRKAIQMIVAFPAGGSTDIGARIVAASAEKVFGQPVVVVNKAGAGGQLGFTEAARARPDGTTRTRPLCPYPQHAVWKGTGTTDDAANFVCRSPRD